MERLARVLVLVLATAAIVTPLAARWMQTNMPDVATVELHGIMAESGGWSPEVIKAAVGQPLRLRMTSDDVMHGFAVGQTDWPALDIAPGEVVETDLVFDRPGKYTFYCTRWCGPNHWRMRGVIEVTTPNLAGPAVWPTSEPPLFQQLGLNLDAMPELDPEVSRTLGQLTRPPSAERGETLKVELPSELRQRDWLRSHTPAEAFLRLRGDGAYSALSDAQLWDVVAFTWRNAATETLARAAKLYARDCAACHGEQGRGDGPAGYDLPGLQAMMPEPILSEAEGLKRGPADFTDWRRMAALSDAHLQGKLLRGGMGTGMPEFGSVYSADDQWAVIAFIRTFMMNASSVTAATFAHSHGSEQ